MNTMLWQTLAAKAVEGTLLPEEARQLLVMCRESPESREALVKVMAMERLLPLVSTDPSGMLTAREVAMRLDGGKNASVEIAWRATERARQWLWRRRLKRFVVAAAAVVVLGFSSWWLVATLTPAASISGNESVRWSGRSPVTASNGLARGSRLQADAGLLELEFHSGARMVLEGPFDVELRDGLSAYLHQGRISVRCPHSATGFTVETKRGKVVDLGTEFCVEMIKDGPMEVQVLSGHVNVIASGETTALLEGDALQVSGRRHKVRGSANASRFVTSLPMRKSSELGYIHWSFDDGNGLEFPNSGNGLGTENDTTLHLLGFPELKPTAAKAPKWIKGKFGGALQFDGKSSYGETEFRGIGGQNPRTVALWVRVAKDIKDPEGFGVVSWGVPHGAGAWQVSINTDAKAGPLGMLRVGTYDGGVVVGSTDLRDDDWHHVAVVMYAGSRPNVANNVLLYVDGQLEAVSRKAMKEIDTDILDAPHGVWIGRNIVYPDKPGKPNQNARFFHGAIDEVYIFNDSLGHDEISRLMLSNQPP